MFLSRGKHESFSLKLIRTRSRDPVTGTNNYIRNNKNPLIRKFENERESTRFYILTFHRRDTILWDFIPKGIPEERINRNGKILKTDCRFIDLPEGRICVGRGEKYRAAKKYPSFISYVANMEYG